MHTHEMTRLWVALNVLHYSLSVVGGNLAPKALLALNFNINTVFWIYPSNANHALQDDEFSDNSDHVRINPSIFF